MAPNIYVSPEYLFLALVRAGPSWSSTTSESTVAAVAEACKQLVANLEPWCQVRTDVASLHRALWYISRLSIMIFGTDMHMILETGCGAPKLALLCSLGSHIQPLT